MSYYPNQPFDPDVERRRAAATRDYTTPAVLVLVLYFVMWLPGLIANIIYYMQAAEDERLAGSPPRGKGCLTALLIVWIVVPIVSIGLFCIFASMAGGIATISPR